MPGTHVNTPAGARRTDRIGQRLRGSVTRVGSLTLLLVAVVWADGRTILKPGWNMFSPQQDVEVGQQVSPDAERQLPMLNNARVDNYVDSLGRRLASAAPGEPYPYHFKVVNDPAINAFALPGGPIYVNRGVIEAADSESQLAGVLAHEISHVALRHGTNQASKASAAQLPLAVLGSLIGSDSTKSALAQLGASFAVNSILLKYLALGRKPGRHHGDPDSLRFWVRFPRDGPVLREDRSPAGGPRSGGVLLEPPEPGQPHRTRGRGSDPARRRTARWPPTTGNSTTSSVTWRRCRDPQARARHAPAGQMQPASPAEAARHPTGPPDASRALRTRS